MFLIFLHFTRAFAGLIVLFCYILAGLGKLAVDFKVCRTHGNWRCECATLNRNVNPSFPSRICNAMNTASENTVMILVRHLVTYSSGINQCCSLKIIATEDGDPLLSPWWCNDCFPLKCSGQL